MRLYTKKPRRLFACAIAVFVAAGAFRVLAAAAEFGRAARAVGVTDVLKAVRTPSTKALTMVNVWASWCDPCREEMPTVLRFYRENHARGFRLILVSVDDDDQEGRGQLRAALREAAEQAHLMEAELADVQVFLKAESDTTFVNGLDPTWSGSLPASFLFSASGTRERSWHGPVTYRDLDQALASRLTRSGTESKQRANGGPASPVSKPKN